MAKNKSNFDPIGLSSFFGGQSVDKKLGTQAQFYDDLHLDFRSEPSNFTILPQGTEGSGGVVSGLVQAIDQINSGARYAVDDAGKVYQITTSNVWSSLGTLGESGSAGLIYRADLDNIYIPAQTKLSRIFHVSSGASLTADFFKNGISKSATCYKTGGTNTYTVPVTPISEAATDKRAFTTDIEPLYKLGVFVVAKGTGNWTLTLHDDANNVLGTVTIANASLTNGAVNYFVFSSPIRLQRGDLGAGAALTYHFHVTSTVADGTLQTTTAGSLADCDMELWANALVQPNNGLHPTINFLDMTLIGNSNYVASYEPLQDSPTTSDYNRHRLTLPPGFEVCGFAQKNLMVVVGCEKRSSTGEFQEGVLLYWDGISDTYNDWWPVPEGSPESLFSTQNTVYFVANGALYQIQGTDQPVKLRTLRNTNAPFTSTNNITHAYPNMMTVHHGLLHIGYPSVTTNVAVQHGVYTYGTISREYPISLGFSYTASPGNLLNTGGKNLRLGMVKSYGDTMYISWRDDSNTPHYGVDIVDNSSAPASTFSITPLIFDDNRAYAYKKGGYIVCTFDPWPSGATLTLRYKFDDDSGYTSSDQTPATGDQYIVMPVERNFLVAEFGLTGTVGSTTPKISSLFMWVDPLVDERPVGGG